MKTDFLIIGAGISGLTAALTLKSKQPGAKVVILDAAKTPGGLLRSIAFDYENGSLAFDMGTHIPELTTDIDLNTLIFPEDITSKWQVLSKLKVGNYFSNALNNDSQFITISTEHHLFCQVLTELLQTQHTDLSAFINLEDFLCARYGPTLTQSVLKPLITKMTASDLSALAPQTINFYGLSRIAFGNRQIGLNLKKVPHLDKALAFAQDNEQPRQATWVYPGAKGVGEWVNFMHQSCLNSNVEFLLEQRIKILEQTDTGYKLVTDNGVIVHTSHLIWTLPFYIGLQGGEQTSYISRSIALYHFSSTQAPTTDCHYFYCQQPDMYSYRLTFYDNFTPKMEDQPFRTTVEVIFDGEAPSEEKIRSELLDMGLFKKDAEIKSIGTNVIPYGFPVPKVDQHKTQLALFEHVKQQHPNVIFAGRGQPGLFFTTDILMQVYQKINAFFIEKGHV